jgi:predicted dehydrogenase
MKKFFLAAIFVIVFSTLFSFHADSQEKSASGAPVRLAVAGITHDHVGWILSRRKNDIILVGIYEPDQELAHRYAQRYYLDSKIFYVDMQQMLNATKPEVVAAFGSVYQHLGVVQACAPRGIHVMVEKPLAATLSQALEMQSLAQKFNIQLLTNFETSWYPSTVKAYELANDSDYVGSIRKVVVHDGHQGPKEIGVTREFLSWLTDPVQNGGGALMDFGCYGANLMTYLMKGEQPISVTAITQHFKPNVYPKVEDEATIVVSYPTAQCIIQASWNWPFGRKDMEIYGTKGFIIAVNSKEMRLRAQPDSVEHSIHVTATDVPVYEDPFSYLADVIRGKIKVPDNGVYSIKTNITVMRILSAAKESAITKKTVYLKK